MTRPIRLLAPFALLATIAAACGSSVRPSPVVRVFDPTGEVGTQITLAGVDRGQIGVMDYAAHNSAVLWLPFTNSGEASFCRLTDALLRRGAATHNHHERYAVELNGHLYESSALYSLDYTYNHPGYCRGGPAGIQVVMGHTTAGQATHLLLTLGLLNSQALESSASATVAGGSRTYPAAAVKAVFARHGFRLGLPGLWGAEGLPRPVHALLLSYSQKGGVVFTKKGAVLTSGGPYFAVAIFRSPAAARSLFSPAVVLRLRSLSEAWARSSNVVLVSIRVIDPNHPGAVWQRALRALKTLGH